MRICRKLQILTKYSTVSKPGSVTVLSGDKHPSERQNLNLLCDRRTRLASWQQSMQMPWRLRTMSSARSRLLQKRVHRQRQQRLRPGCSRCKRKRLWRRSLPASKRRC